MFSLLSHHHHKWDLKELAPPNLIPPTSPKSFQVKSKKPISTSIGREIFISRYLNEKLFKEGNFVETFTKSGLRNFVFKYLKRDFLY